MSETSHKPPAEDLSAGINCAAALSVEATAACQAFSQQVRALVCVCLGRRRGMDGVCVVAVMACSSHARLQLFVARIPVCLPRLPQYARIIATILCHRWVGYLRED